MIEVTVTVHSDGEVRVIEVLGFDEQNMNEGVWAVLNQVLSQESGWLPDEIPSTVASQVSRLARYLLENYFLRDSRIIVYRDNLEISRIEYKVASSAPSNSRPTRFEHEPVI
jgi:hypothetical protein